MADTDTVVTPQSETVVTEPLKNDAPAVGSNQIDPEQLKRERQEFMRAQEENKRLKAQLEAEAKAKADAEAKQLEEQNQFKTLYEQEKAKRQEIETAQAQAERAQMLKAESDKLFAQYPEAVRKIAEATNLTLTDADEEAVAALKGRLDVIKDQVKQPKVTANNPGAATSGTQELSNDDMQAMLKDPAKFEAYMKKNRPGIASMMKPVAD